MGTIDGKRELPLGAALIWAGAGGQLHRRCEVCGVEGLCGLECIDGIELLGLVEELRGVEWQYPDWVCGTAAGGAVRCNQWVGDALVPREAIYRLGAGGGCAVVKQAHGIKHRLGDGLEGIPADKVWGLQMQEKHGSETSSPENSRGPFHLFSIKAM